MGFCKFMYPKTFGQASKDCKNKHPVLGLFSSITEEIIILPAYLRPYWGKR